MTGKANRSSYEVWSRNLDWLGRTPISPKHPGKAFYNPLALCRCPSEDSELVVAVPKSGKECHKRKEGKLPTPNRRRTSDYRSLYWQKKISPPEHCPSSRNQLGWPWTNREAAGSREKRREQGKAKCIAGETCLSEMPPKRETNPE